MDPHGGGSKQAHVISCCLYTVQSCLSGALDLRPLIPRFDSRREGGCVMRLICWRLCCLWIGIFFNRIRSVFRLMNKWAGRGGWGVDRSEEFFFLGLICTRRRRRCLDCWRCVESNYLEQLCRVFWIWRTVCMYILWVLVRYLNQTVYVSFLSVCRFHSL